MLGKGIIFLLIFVLFVSRLIPKYDYFIETNQVHLFGLILEGVVGLLSLAIIAILTIVLLGLGISNIIQYFSTKRSDAGN